MTSFFNRRFLILFLLCCAFQLMATGPADASAPQAPSNVMASDGIYGDKVIINWDTVPGAEKYVILRSERPVSRGGVMTRLAILSRTYYEDTPPECGLVYYYWVRAVNDDGASRFSHAKGSCGTAGTEPITGTLQSPENVSATDGDFTDKIQITWDRSPGAASYDIYRAEDFSAPKTRLGSTTNTTFDDTTPDCCIDYYYWVKAKKGGEESDFFYSDIGYRDCPVSAPTHVNASDGAQEDAVLVTWKASTGATSYDIYRATSPTGNKSKIADTTDTQYTDTRVTCDDVYFYWIQANNLCSTSIYSDSDSGYPNCLTPSNGNGGNDTSQPIQNRPATPTGLRASDGQYTDRIVISWNAAANVASYNIYRSTHYFTKRILIASTTSTSYIDKDIPVSTKFFYWVNAQNTANDVSEFSNFDTGYRFCPAAPTIRATKDLYLNKIEISWNASIGAIEYDLYRSFYNAPPVARKKIATLKGTSYTEHLEECIVDYCPGCANPPNQPYYYWVRAKSSDCVSPFSNSDYGYIHCRPPAPTALRASDGVNNDIIIQWNSHTKEHKFEAWRAKTPDGLKEKIATVEKYGIYVDRTAACNTYYYYWVRRIDTKGFASHFSNYDSGYYVCD